MNTEELQQAYNDLAAKVKGPFAILARRIHKNSVAKGFYDEPVVMDKVAAKIALIHSEATETLEALRKNKGADKVTEEINDILIRTLDLHDWLVELELATDNLDQSFVSKMVTNENRPPKHGHAWG